MTSEIGIFLLPTNFDHLDLTIKCDTRMCMVEHWLYDTTSKKIIFRMSRIQKERRITNKMNKIVQEVHNKYSFLNNLLTKLWRSWFKSNITFKLHLRNVRWKNDKATPDCAYQPTKIEQLANIITHGIWIIPAIVCANKLFERSKNSSQYLVCWVYGGALTMLFIISTFFHCSCFCTNHKNILHRCDRAMIYIFIAGSYFPWLQLQNPRHLSLLVCMEWMIWVMAAIGITYQQLFHERFKCLETCFYVIMGLGPAVAVLSAGHQFHGMTELKFGGFLYIVGVYFFKSDGIIPMAHAIWHLFVVFAATCHYYAILTYLYPLENTTPSN
ncbi:monocyte to macrophage differentiation factor isoform 2-T2 [Glossina fuscipes fuscipes]